MRYEINHDILMLQVYYDFSVKGEQLPDWVDKANICETKYRLALSFDFSKK